MVVDVYVDEYEFLLILPDEFFLSRMLTLLLIPDEEFFLSILLNELPKFVEGE